VPAVSGHAGRVCVTLGRPLLFTRQCERTFPALNVLIKAESPSFEYVYIYVKRGAADTAGYFVYEQNARSFYSTPILEKQNRPTDRSFRSTRHAYSRNNVLPPTPHSVYYYRDDVVFVVAFGKPSREPYLFVVQRPLLVNVEQDDIENDRFSSPLRVNFSSGKFDERITDALRPGYQDRNTTVPRDRH